MPPRSSAGPVPRRPAGSVRRTSSIDVTWPQGMEAAMRLAGRARDLSTPRTGGLTVIAEDSFTATVRKDWTIVAIEAKPARPGLDRLVGERGTTGFRKALREAVPGEEDTPLRLILEDVPGAALVSGVAWAQWDPDWMKKAFGDLSLDVMLKAREGVCIGHAPDSSAQDPGLARSENERPDAADLERKDDPHGWHALAHQDGVGFRRMRRIDVSAGEVITIDAEFQDSVAKPGGKRAAVHEYGIMVTADSRTLRLLTIATDPRVLPYRECPSVSANLPRLIGVPLPELRNAVPVALDGAAGCTHLNDAFRALAAVPALLRHLA